MNLQSQLLFGGLIFLLGLIAGFVVFWLTKEDEGKKPEQTVEHLPGPSASPPVGGAVKIGTIWREEGGRVLVQKPDGSFLEPEIVQEMLGVTWPSVTHPEQPTIINQPPPQPSTPSREEHPRPVAPQSLEGISQPMASKPVEPVSTNAVESISRAFQKTRPPAPRSLAQQINDILQDRIAGTELARRGLRLVDLPNQELGVEVDLHTYPGIDQVPDSAVTQAIRDAAKEWQARNR